jgi:hypothetical protein
VTLPIPPAGVPIVIGLQSTGEFSGLAASGLGEFFAAEFRARRERYPNSCFLLYIRAAAGLAELARAAAAACNITVVEARAGTLAPLCHLLIDIAAAAAGDADGTVLSAQTSEGESIEFEAELKVEVIRLQWPTGREPLRQMTSLFGLDGAIHDHLVHPAPENRLMMRTDRFNRDAQAVLGVATAAEPAELTIEALYLRADALALAFQRKSHLAFRLIFALACLAAVFYGCFLAAANSRVGLQDELIGGYVALIVISYCVFLYARRLDLHSRFVEYRALAEGLRVQHYWQACGLTRSAAACYLIRQPLDYQWIRLALWRAAAVHPSASTLGGQPQQAVPVVLQGWIDDQQRYFTRSHARSARVEVRMRYLVAGIFLLGVCASLSIMFARHLPISKPTQLRLSLISFLCPGVSAAIVALVTKLGLLYQASHYGRMQAIFDQARRRLSRQPAETAGHIASALGEEALLENESWAQFRRERGLDEPTSPLRRPW